jgi:peptidoglycan hydrolase CwlO-like protein
MLKKSCHARSMPSRFETLRQQEPALKSILVLSLTLLFAAPALAQDVPGIEICTVEKTMERRTSCLQSNIDFLKKTITKASLDSQQRIDATNRQVDALKATVAGLQKTIDDLKAQVQTLEKKPAAK